MSTRRNQPAIPQRGAVTSPARAPWRLLEPEAIAALLALGERVEAHRGAIIDCDAALVLSGVLGAQHQLSGRRVLSALLHGGDVIELTDEDAAPDSAPRRQLIVLSKQAEYLALPRDRFVDGGFERADLTCAWAQALSRQIAALRRHCADVSTLTPIARTARALLELRAAATADDAQPLDLLTLQLRRGDIADYIGVKPETLSRAFRQLEATQAISARRLTLIQINDVAALSSIAEGRA